MAKALILTDGKAGHENQSKALARALGCEFDILEVHFKSKLHKALSYIFDRLGVRTLALLRFDDALSAAHFTEMRPREEARHSCGDIPMQSAEMRPREAARHSCGDIPMQSAEMRPQEVGGVDVCGRSSANCAVVIGTGSGTFYAAKALAKTLGVRCGVVLYPRGYDLASFDCILAPAFDRPASAPNVIEIPANLVANDAAFYEKGVVAFKDHYHKTTGRQPPTTNYQLPITNSQLPTTNSQLPTTDYQPPTSVAAVIVGGPNKCSTMTVEWMKGELDRIFGERQQAHDNKLFWVTTSRRTPAEVEQLVDSYPWDYKLIYSRDQFNPIPAFVSLAQKLYVTAESTGMLSEACTFGTAEVHPLDNLNPGPHKFRRFMEGLVAAGCERGAKLDLAPLFARARSLLGLDA